MSIGGNNNNINENSLNFEVKLSESDSKDKSLEVTFCGKTVQVAIESFKKTDSFFDKIQYYLQKIWNYITNKKVIVINIPEDKTTKKTTEVGLNALNFQNVLGDKYSDKEKAGLINIESDRALEEIKFKAFCDVFFNGNEDIRNESWGKLSQSQPNYNEIMGFIQRALKSSHENWQKIPQNLLEGNNPLQTDLQHELKKVVLSTVRQNGQALQFANVNLKNDKEVVLAAVRNYGKALEYASPELRNNIDVVSAAVRNYDYHPLVFAGKDAIKKLPGISSHIYPYVSKGVMIELIEESPYHFMNASQDLKNDRDVALAAIRKEGNLLVHASNNLKNDEEVVLAAIKQNPFALLHASNELKNNERIVLEVVGKNGKLLKHASSDLKNNERIVLAAVTTNGDALEYASPDLKNNQQIVLAAVSQNSFALGYASSDLKNNKDIVRAAVNQNTSALKHAGIDVKSNRDFVLELVSQSGAALEYASPDLKNDKDVVLAAVSRSGFALEFASSDLKNDRDVVLAAINQNDLALKYASPDLKNDRDVVLAAINKNGLALKYASAELRNNRDVVLAAINQNGLALDHASEELKKDPEFLRISIYNRIEDSKCKIDGKRYFPKALNQSLKSLKLPELPPHANIAHLKSSLSSFIDDLAISASNDVKVLNTIRQELGLLPNAPLNECMAKLREYHASLFRRVENKENYTGTPPAGTQELTDFYKKIETYLCHLDAFFSKEENKLPEALVERLQLLQTQSACGARFQAEAEQLFSLNCIPMGSMTLDKQLALIASSEAKKSIESITEDRNVHDINMKTYQLDQFLVGDRVQKDHLGHLSDETTLTIDFLNRHTSINLVDTIQSGLKTGSELETVFTDYLKENFAIPLSEDEKEQIRRDVELDWQVTFDEKVKNFTNYNLCKQGQGPFASFQNKSDDIRRKMCRLTAEEAQFEDVDAFKIYLNEKKDSIIQKNISRNLTDKSIEKLYKEYYDGNPETGEGALRWKPSIIAMALEKMGILETV